MIEKLSINYASAIYPNEKMLAEKINEIIDTLSKPSVPSVSTIFDTILEQKPRGLLGNTTGGGTMADAYPYEYKIAQAIHNLLTGEER